MSYGAGKVNELKYLLMARAHALVDLRLFALAYNDLEVILAKLDSNMAVAIQLMQLVNSQRA